MKPFALIAVLTLVVMSAPASAAPPRPHPKNPAACRNQWGGRCKSGPGATTTTTSAAHTSGASKPGSQAASWDGHYAGTLELTVHNAGADIHNTTPINWVITNGKPSQGLFGAVGAISNLGQLSVVMRMAGYGGMGGTVYFVHGANDAVEVHAQIQGQLTSGSVVTIIFGTIKASRISR